MYSKFLIYLSGFIFVLYFFFVFTLSILSFTFHGNIIGEFVYFAIILSVLVCALFLRLVFGKGLYYLGAIIPFFVLIVGLMYGVSINKNLYDISFDGQSYHGEAIVTLIQGWNPIMDISSKNANEFVDLSGNERWINAYPKASWYNSVAMHRLTRDFKDVKFFNFAILLGSIFIVFCTLLNFIFSKRKILDYAIRVILTILFCMSPIALLQTTNANLDGQLYGFLLVLYSTLYLLYNEFGKNKILTWVYLINIILTLIVLINVKTAGLVYGIFFFCAFSVFVFLTKSIEWKKLILTLITSLVLGVCVFGYNPYITNIKTYGNFLFPQFGVNAFDYLENTPSNYRNKNNAEIFLSSLFFKSSDIFLEGIGEPAELKLPLTVYDSELVAIRNPQLKKGGFGPLFSGILLLSLIALLSALASYYFEITKNNPYTSLNLQPQVMTGLIAIIFISITFGFSFILTKTSNTFRYIPHLWTLIGLWSLFTFQSKSVISKVVTTMVIFLVLLNTIIISQSYFGFQIEKSKEIAKLMSEWSTSGDSYIFDFGYHTSSRLLLMENHIPFKVSIKSKACDQYKPEQNVLIAEKISMVYGCIYTK